MLIADGGQLAAGEFKGFFPAGFTEHVHDAVGVHVEVAAFGRVGAADQGHGQAMRVVGVVKAVATLDTQAAMVGRAIPAFNKQNLVVFDVVGQLATHAAIRADRRDLFVGHAQGRLACGHQGAGRAGLHAFAAGHAGRGAHGVVHVENDLRLVTSKGQTNHVIDLLVTAGA